jgi:Fic family protein
MDPDRFPSQDFGTVEKKPGDKWAFWYYRPKYLPREISLSSETVYSLSRADAALGRLSGIGRLLETPEILVQPYLTREALASSRIEGTVASLSDVFQANANEEPSGDEDVKEVQNYQRALYYGIEQLQKLPLGVRLAKGIHEVLLKDVRGQEKLPGELRESPVWIGSATDSPETAAFVPPLSEELGDFLADWERFINDRPRIPLLVRCALMHYQFETIHPSLDGNGRIGRLLIILMLLEEKAIPHPLLYVSAYMESHRQQYYERLQGVRERGEIQEWLQFFLTAVEHQARDAESRAEKLVKLEEGYRRELRGTKSRAAEVVGLLFRNPFLTVRRVERALGVTNQGARNLIESLEKRGWLTRVDPTWSSGRFYWVGLEIFSIIQDDLDSHES